MALEDVISRDDIVGHSRQEQNMGKKQRSLTVTCGVCESRDRVGFSVAKAVHRRI